MHKPEIKARIELWRYGQTSSALIEAQHGLCAICGDALDLGKRTHMDHKENRVRGVLCHLCNVGLGHFRDSIPNLQAAILYLERAK
jgi:hypothetical protein